MSFHSRSILVILAVLFAEFVIGCGGDLPYLSRGLGNLYGYSGYNNGRQTYGYPVYGYQNYGNGYGNYQSPNYSYYSYPTYYSHHHHHGRDEDHDGD